MSLLAQLDQKIAANGGLIVSCQPVPDSPLDKPEIVAAMALAAEQAGAVAIRIEGVANLQATRAVVKRADYWNCETRSGGFSGTHHGLY